MSMAFFTLLAFLVLMAAAIVGAWRTLESDSETSGAKRGLLMFTVFGGGFLALTLAIILTARGACALLDCRGYVESQQAAPPAAQLPGAPPGDAPAP